MEISSPCPKPSLTLLQGGLSTNSGLTSSISAPGVSASINLDFIILLLIVLIALTGFRQ